MDTNFQWTVDIPSLDIVQPGHNHHDEHIPTDPRKVSYEYIIMLVLDKVGISQSESVLEKILELQQAENRVGADLQEILDILIQLHKLGISKEDLLKLFKQGKDGKVYLDKHSEAYKKLYKFLVDDSNMAKFANAWKDLFKGKDCAFSQLYKALIANGDKDPLKDSGFLKQLYELGQGKDSTFVDFDDDEKGAIFKWLFDDSYSQDDFVGALEAFCKVYYEQVFHDSGDNKTYVKNPLGSAETSLSSLKAQISSLSQENSVKMSLASQTLSSYVQIGQQVVQTAAEGKKYVVNNEKAY